MYVPASCFMFHQCYHNLSYSTWFTQVLDGITISVLFCCFVLFLTYTEQERFMLWCIYIYVCWFYIAKSLTFDITWNLFNQVGKFCCVCHNGKCHCRTEHWQLPCSNNNDNNNHCAANCLQHVCSSGLGVTVCKSCATHRALIMCMCNMW